MKEMFDLWNKIQRLIYLIRKDDSTDKLDVKTWIELLIKSHKNDGDDQKNGDQKMAVNLKS